MKYKHIDEHDIKHELNTALNNLLDKEKIKVKGEELAHNIGLEQDYFELLNTFEEHLKFIIKANKGNYFKRFLVKNKINKEVKNEMPKM